MRETLLTIFAVVGVAGIIAVYFINERSLVRSLGSVFAITIACVLGYRLFVPLAQGVNIRNLIPELIMIASAPLAVMLTVQALCYIASAISGRRRLAVEHGVGDEKVITGQEPIASGTAALIKGKMTGKERLAAMLRDAGADEVKSEEEVRTDEMPVVQPDKAADPDAICDEEETSEPRMMGRERLEAMLKEVAEEEAAKNGEENNEPVPDDIPELKFDRESEHVIELEPVIEPDLVFEQELLIEVDNAIEPVPVIEPEPVFGHELPNDEADNVIELEQGVEPELEHESSHEPKPEPVIESEKPSYPEEAKKLLILSKAFGAKASGGTAIAAQLFEMYLGDPVDEQSKTKAMQGLLDCYISQKRNTEARELCIKLVDRVDEEAARKMRILLQLLK